MKIVFTPDIFYMQHYGGISRYFVRLAEALYTAHQKAEIVAPFHINQYLAQSHLDKSGHAYSQQICRSRKTARALNSVALQYHLLLARPEILHSTFFRRFPPVLTDAKRVVTVFDLIDELFYSAHPTGTKLAAQKRRAVDEADLVICISEATRHDLIQMLGVSSDKIRVTYLAADTPPEPTEHAAHPLNGHPYILFVGSRFGYKNFDGLIEAYAHATGVKREFKLVIFGSSGFDESEMEYLDRYGLTQSQVIYRSGPDEELYRYYRYAELFVYPSKYEGFGIPPLEAMSVGCPVACSNISSIPEVVGDAAFMFDPSSVESMASTLELALSDKQLRAEKISRGSKQYLKFSWEKCAQDTLKAYESVLEPSS